MTLLFAAITMCSAGLRCHCTQAVGPSAERQPAEALGGSTNSLTHAEMERCREFRKAKGKERYTQGLTVRRILKARISGGPSTASTDQVNRLDKSAIIHLLGQPEKEVTAEKSRTTMAYDLNPKSGLLRSATLLVVLDGDAVVDVFIAKDG